MEQDDLELYPLPTKQDFDNFRSTCDSDSADWRLSYDDQFKQIKVWEQRIPNSSINRIRMYAHMVGLSADTLYDVLHDAEYRKVWDLNMAEGYTITLLDSYNDIGYYAGKSPFFAVSGRDFCNQRSWWVSEDKSEFIIMNHSVTHPDIPERKQYVRGWSHRTGYIIRKHPANEKSCDFIYCTQTDLRGWIPDKLINKAIKTFAPSLVDKMVQVCPGYPEWKQKNSPEIKPWLSGKPYHWELNSNGAQEKKSPQEEDDMMERVDEVHWTNI